MNPSYRPSLVDGNRSDTQVLPFAGSDLDVSPVRWRFRVTGMNILFRNCVLDRTIWDQIAG